MIHQIESKNEWWLLSVTFAPKLELVFVHSKTLFLRIFILKPTERAYVLLKNGTRDFQNSPPFERSACFYVSISESFKRFQYFNFETNFLENENLLQKLEYLLLVEATKIENTSFPFKTALSEANVKTCRMATTKRTYHKEWSFASN